MLATTGQMKAFTSLANPEYENPPFVAFQSVTTGTRLENLNLNWRERDLPERERTKHVHRMHPYLGKYIPQLVEIFLRKFKPRSVYDPFCGSGTTLVEANALGIESIGCDISAFNCLVTNAKVRKYDTTLASREIRAALAELESSFSGTLFSKARPIETENEYLRAWFSPEALRALLLYRELIDQFHHRDLMKVILSRAARSARLTTHHNLDFPRKPQTEPYQCRKHDRTCSPTTDAFQFIRRYSLDTIERIEAFSRIRTDAPASVIWGDAQSVKLPKFDMIMTSPPYVGLIDYHDQHRYAYELLGLPRREDNEIGAAFKGKSAKAHEEYMSGIKKVLENARRHLRPRGVAVIVVGDREGLYKDTLAGELNFRVLDRLSRHVNRRTGRRNSDFFESVLIWEAT